MNLMTIFEKFPTSDHAREYIQTFRLPDGFTCPRCSCKNISELKSRKQFTCLNKECHYRFSAISDTVMHSTKLDLRKWLCAICLITIAKKSLSSHQLSRDLKISIKRAWHLNHRIRAAMADDPEQLELFKETYKQTIIIMAVRQGQSRSTGQRVEEERTNNRSFLRMKWNRVQFARKLFRMLRAKLLNRYSNAGLIFPQQNFGLIRSVGS